MLEDSQNHRTVDTDGQERTSRHAPSAGGNEPRRCSATTKAGGPCTAPPLKDASTCFLHDDRRPARAKQAAARRKAGLAATGGPQIDLTTPRGQQRALEDIVTGMKAGALSQARASIMLRAVKSAMALDKHLRKHQPQRIEVRLRDWAAQAMRKAEQQRPEPS